MKILTNLALAGLLMLTSVGASFAADGYLVRVDPSKVNSVASQFGLRVEREISKGSGLYLVHIPRVPGLVQALKAHPAVKNIEANSPVALPETVASSAAKFPLTTNPKTGKPAADVSKIPGLTPTTVNGKIVTLAPSYDLYMSQPGIAKINLPPASYNGQGATVAVIDTWIDATNKTLAPVINTALAYDCISNQRGGASITQETSPFIDQETSPFIDGSGTVLVNQETSPFIDQETSPFIDQETSPFIDAAAWGHGTMVAGLVHRVAWNATIVPIRAFQNDGSGAMADVIQGIYYAVDVAKVDVINMSFSAPTDSPELKAAIRHAQDKGVICIAAVSNSNSSANVYPAAEQGVSGIAATNYDDTKASFSDYGSDVDFAAPGVDMTSTFPNFDNESHWATGSGTSFAVPLVSGAAAVLKSIRAAVDADNAASYLENSADPVSGPYASYLGHGRLDVMGAISLLTGRHW